MTRPLRDAHRHIGRMPAYPFYGGPADPPRGTPQGSLGLARARLFPPRIQGAASDIDQVGVLVEDYAGPDGAPIHLVHLGGGMSGHMKLIGGRLFDWIEQGFQVYTDTSWTIGFAPVWLVKEIERRGVGHDRILFATDAPWGDFEGEYS